MSRAKDLALRFKAAIRAHQAATDLFDETYCQFLGINRTDGRCLDIVDRFGRISAGQLAIESGLTTGAVTAVIDRLEAAGYLRRIRDRVDRRKVWVETTEAMREIAHRVFGYYMSSGMGIVEQFTPGERDAIMRFLNIGTFLNTELAAALRAHASPVAGTADARLEQAKAFARAMAARTPRLDAEMRTIDSGIHDLGEKRE